MVNATFPGWVPLTQAEDCAGRATLNPTTGEEHGRTTSRANITSASTINPKMK